MRFTSHSGRSVWMAFVLTVVFGVTMAQAQSQPGFGPAIDFNGDGLPDIADHHLASGQFWIRLNLGGGSFQAPGLFWGSGTTSTPSGTWTYLTANFNGDAWGDYMDVHPASGQFWYHAGLGGGAFSGFGVFGSGLQVGANWEVFAARAYLTDNYAEFIEHNRATGELRVWYNYFGALINPFPPSSWSSTVGTDWRLLVGDFTGDGLADVADYHIPSGQFWIHRNLGNANFDAAIWATATANPAFTTIVGDYNGDGLADYADLNKSTGQFYIHLNLGGGVFNPITWGAGGVYTASSGWNVLGTPIVF